MYSLRKQLLIQVFLAEHAVLGSRRLGTMGAQANRRHRFHLYLYSNKDYRAERITVHPAGAKIADFYHSRKGI